MACTVPRYASAWSYAAFWCLGSIIAGVDDSGGAGNASLQDLQANFINAGLEANVGMVMYNTTQGTSGVITAVTATTVTATGVTWDNADGYRAVAISGIQIATVEHYLNLTANNIKAAMAAVGACDCTLASWAFNGLYDGTDFLGKLNVIEAGGYHTCPCAMPGQRMTPDQRANWLRLSSEMLNDIVMGKIELCAGETGSTFPVIGWASQGLTPFSAAEIIANENS